MTDLFGQRYADVFVEPSVPVLRVPVTELHPSADPLAALVGGQTMPVSLLVSE